MTETAEAAPPISPKALSNALAALGAYAEPPDDAQLAAAEMAEGRAGLAAWLANALYGSALAHVMTTEIVAEQAGAGGGYRAEAWRAAGATGEGTAILLHYTAMRLVAGLHAAFCEVVITIEDMVADGDRLVGRWVMRGVNTGSFNGMPATDRPVTLMGFDLLRVEGDRFAEVWGVADIAGMLQQLGVMPGPPSA